MNKMFVYLLPSLSLFFFSVANAQSGDNFQGIIATVLRIFNTVTIIIISLSVLYFLFGLVKYVASADESAQAEAKGVIANGIIILFSMVAVWGLVAVVSNTLEINEKSVILQNKEIPINSLIK